MRQLVRGNQRCTKGWLQPEQRHVGAAHVGRRQRHMSRGIVHSTCNDACYCSAGIRCKRWRQCQKRRFSTRESALYRRIAPACTAARWEQRMWGGNSVTSCTPSLAILLCYVAGVSAANIGGHVQRWCPKRRFTIRGSALCRRIAPARIMTNGGSARGATDAVYKCILFVRDATFLYCAMVRNKAYIII